MSVYSWATHAVQQNLQAGKEAGFDEVMVLRALLTQVVEASKAQRSAQDLAQELQFLAENLDDDRDYAFMRP